MKYLFTLLLSVILFSCSKDTDENKAQDRTLQVVIKDKIHSVSGNHVWAIDLIFNPQVTIAGSVKVDFDVYNLNAFYKHYSQKINFSLSNANTFTYETAFGSALQGPEIKNIIVDSLVQTSGNYNITIK